MSTQGRRVNHRYDTEPQAIKTWQASTPGVSGIDALHSFAADRRRQYPKDNDPVPPQGEIPYPGPYTTTRLSPVASQQEWDSRNPRSQIIRTTLVTQDPAGFPENPYALAPINPATGAKHTGRMPARVTQYVGPGQYTLMRRFGLPIARTFTGQHVSFATPPTATIGDFGTGRAGRKSLRTTQRIIPTPDALQKTSVLEYSNPGGLIPQGSSLTRYW